MIFQCWRRSPRGHDHQLIFKRDLVNQRHLTPALSLDVHFTHCSHARNHSKEAALRKYNVIEAIWIVSMPEPH